MAALAEDVKQHNDALHYDAPKRLGMSAGCIAAGLKRLKVTNTQQNHEPYNISQPSIRLTAQYRSRSSQPLPFYKHKKGSRYL
jgi:hypothetical protein